MDFLLDKSSNASRDFVLDPTCSGHSCELYPSHEIKINCRLMTSVPFFQDGLVFVNFHLFSIMHIYTGKVFLREERKHGITKHHQISEAKQHWQVEGRPPKKTFQRKGIAHHLYFSHSLKGPCWHHHKLTVTSQCFRCTLLP